MGTKALGVLSARHEVVVVVQPAQMSLKTALRPLAVWTGLKKKHPLEEVIEKQGILHFFAKRTDARLSRMLETLRPDIICIASYRWVLAPATYAIPRFGAINVHPSLLPRHRGRVPLFWVYYENDHLSGVTVHRVTEQADAGPILLQQSFDVPRGWPIDEMHDLCAQLGANLLAEACNRIETRTAVYRPQEDNIATSAPKVAPGTRMVDFSFWPAERVWHFLAGLSPHYREPLLNSQNQVVRYRNATGFRTGVELGVSPGVAVAVPNGWLLQCREGVVELSGDQRTHRACC